MLIFENREQYWKKSWMNYSECNQSNAFLFSHKDCKYKIALFFSLCTNKRDCRFRGSWSRCISKAKKRPANSCCMAGATLARPTLDRKVHKTTLVRRVHKNEASQSKGLCWSSMLVSLNFNLSQRELASKKHISNMDHSSKFPLQKFQIIHIKKLSKFKKDYKDSHAEND